MVARFTLAFIALCTAFAASFAAEKTAQAQTSTGQPGSGGLPPQGFASQTKSRPEHVEEDLIGTPRDIRSVPRAPTLPDLTHRAGELSSEQTIASVDPNPPPPGSTSPDRSRLTSYLFHFDVEAPIREHWLYAGAQWSFAAARGAEQPKGQFVPGQPEVFARVVKSFDDEKYDVGAGLGVLPSLFTYDSLSEQRRLETATAASLVSIVRPWDVSVFLDRRVTVRPWIDARAKNRHLLAQFRQALDTNLRVSASGCTGGNVVCDRAGDVELISISTLYLAWQPTRELALGVEGWSVYLLKTQLPVSSGDRSAFALSPSVRFYYRWVEPAFSLLVPIGKPLLGAANDYFALRFDLRVWFG